ncbi:endoplasmic reticulum-based factor for assembly of V-ATPase-domain-containing protein [Aspergillus egyptiacus]|nr:endoplasmic reticulum-based factor for assembly of V-ATPase-domain-containing protein [Aspergillus egyptiacus]
MVRLCTTPPILSAFEALPPSTRQDLNLPESLSLGNPISHEDVIAISRYFRSKRTSSSRNETTDADADADAGKYRSLDSLLRGMKLYIPPPPPKPEPSPEYLAQKARLLAAAEADAYNRMLTPNPTPGPGPGVFTSSTPALSALHDTKSPSADTDTTDPLTPSLVLNIFLSVLITGFSVYWALTSFQTPTMLVSVVSSIWSSSSSRSPRQQSQASEPVRVLLSLSVALAVGVAEVLIYAIYLGKIERARGKEGRLKERKEVVGREVIGPASDVRKGEDGKEEGELIWGRGPNGGLRRRVRERWEETEKEKSQVG